MSSMQRVIVVGNLGADPELRYMPSGAAIASISVATSEKWKEKSTGNMQEHTEWFRCTAFNRTAEVIGEYLRKGSKVAIEGKMRTRKWQDQQGNDKYSTDLIIDHMTMLDSKGDTDRPASQPAKQPAKQPARPPEPEMPNFDDGDNPF